MTPFPVRNRIIQRFLTSMQREHWWTSEGPTAMAAQLVENGGVLTAKDQTILGVCYALYNCTGSVTLGMVLYEFTEREVVLVAGAMVAVVRGDTTWWPADATVQSRGVRIRALKVADPEAWEREVNISLQNSSTVETAAKSLGVSVKLLSEWKKGLGL